MRWQDGYPVEQGASDSQDSARLIGLLAVFGYPVDKEKYFDYINHGPGPYYLRHPIERNKYEYSRDQLICYVAGLKALNLDYLHWSYYRPDNGDWLSPSQKSFVERICKGKNGTITGNIWLWLDVLWSCFIDPMAEPCQLICMLKKHPDEKYIRFWVNNNKLWREAIREYFCSQTPGKYNRGEPELAELMIKDLEQYEKNTIA